MNYDCLKNYGVFVRNTAQHISRYDDIYKAASELPYDMRAYHMQSSFACTEICATIEHRPETVSKVIDKYVLSPEIDKYIVNNSIFDASMDFDFIEHDCGNFFDLMQHIKFDIAALKAIAHPSEYDKDYLITALERIAERIKPTPENQAAMMWCYSTLINDARNSHGDQEKDAHVEKKYEITAEKPLFEIFDYLKKTKVIISNDITFHTFRHVVESADASLIQPKTKWKYNVALTFARECIKGESEAWTKDVCASLKIKSNGLTKNIDKDSLWYEELVKLFKNSLK